MNNDDLFCFSRKLRESREAAGYTQETLCHELGLNKSRVSQLEIGRDTAGRDLAIALAQILKVPEQEMLELACKQALAAKAVMTRRRYGLPEQV